MMEYTIRTEQKYTLAEFVQMMNLKHPRLQPELTDLAATLPDSVTITSYCYDYSSLDLNHQRALMSSLMLVMQDNGSLRGDHL